MTSGAGPGGGPTIIEPIDFRGAARPRRRRRSPARWLTLLAGAGLAVVLMIAGWYVVTAREVALTFEPEPERVELAGPAPRFELSDHYLLRSGKYTVRAFHPEYHPLEESFEVERGQANEFRFELRERPGVVTFCFFGADDPEVALDGVAVAVDGHPIGQTPFAGVEIEPGPRSLRVARDRYQALETQFDVEGLGRPQTVALELRPDWADVTLATRPTEAEVLVDGVAVATTPCRIELLRGEHVLELMAEGFEPWRRELEVEAERPIDLADVVLEPTRGRIAVETVPAGAHVTVGGVFAGTTPVEVRVTPNREHLVQVASDGYESAARPMRVGPGERVEAAFELAPQYGVIRLEVTPADAALAVDGTPWGAVTPELTLAALEHRLEFTKTGYRATTRTVRPHPDVPLRITVTLEPIAPPPSEKVDTQQSWKAANGYPLVLIEPATFTMGASRREQGRRSNETLRAVRFERAVLMGVREVTNDEFRSFRPEHGSGHVDGVTLAGDDQPVVQVTWDDAARFCNWFSDLDGLPRAYVEREGRMQAVKPMTIGYRLPTEAEWEHAARCSGTEPPRKYAWGTSYPPPKESGNYADESAAAIINRRIDGYEDDYAATAPAATFPPNPRGLYDMGGNVAEWCHDFYTIYTYDAEAVAVDPMGPERGQHHVVRGASWRDSSISVVRLAYRDYSDEKQDDLGFRICRYLTDGENPDD